MTLITEEARSWAERTFPDYRFQVLDRDIQKYAHAIGETDPIHFDHDTAVSAGYRGIVAPPFFPYVIRMHAAHVVSRDRLAPDGSATDDVPPLSTTRAMAGEVTMELGEAVVARDEITVSKRVVDMYEKEGRSGPLVFVTMEFEFLNQDGAMVARERFTRIYR